jgi:hypothetical protein
VVVSEKASGTDAGTHKAADELVSEEERQGGVVDLGVWMSYFRAPGSYFLFIGVLIFYFLEVGARAWRERGGSE